MQRIADIRVQQVGLIEALDKSLFQIMNVLVSGIQKEGCSDLKDYSSVEESEVARATPLLCPDLRNCDNGTNDPVFVVFKSSAGGGIAGGGIAGGDIAAAAGIGSCNRKEVFSVGNDEIRCERAVAIARDSFLAFFRGFQNSLICLTNHLAIGVHLLFHT